MKVTLDAISAKSKKLLLSPYLPFVLYGAIILVFHFCINLGWGDDAIFVSYLKDSFSLGTLVDVLKLRYQEWSSRVLIEAVLFVLVHAPLLWKILDTAIMIWITVAFSLFFNPQKRTDLNWIIVLCVLAFPITSMSTAGWIATTLNYSWPLALGLFALLPLVRRIQRKKSKLALDILSFPALLFAANHEQMCAVMLAICGLLSLYLWIRDKKFPWLSALQAVLCGASMLFILTCPGNSARTADEILAWFPEFADLSLLRKIELGYSSTMHQLIMQPDLVFTVFCLFLLIAVLVRKQKLLPRILAVVPLTGSLLFGLLSPVTSLLLPNILRLKEQMLPIGSGIQLAHPGTWLPDIVFTLTLLCIFISLLYAFQNKELAFFACFLVLVGLATRIVMGFSPTVWASGSRTFIFLYFSLIAVSILLFSSLKNDTSLCKPIKVLTLCGIGGCTLFVAEAFMEILL